MHFDFFRSLSLAIFTTSAFDIEAEPTRLIASDFRLSRHGEKLPDNIKHTRISCGVASWRFTDRRLIDLDDLINIRHT